MAGEWTKHDELRKDGWSWGGCACDDFGSKVAVDQGVANAGKYLRVGSDGKVGLSSAPSGTGGTGIDGVGIIDITITEV